MKRLLHIIATPRANESNTLVVSNAFLENFKKKFPGCLIDELNVATQTLPPLSIKVVNGKYILLSQKELSRELKAAWEEIVLHIERFLLADAYLISIPMWNFGIPYTLKHYIDIIVQPKYLFRYTDKGVEGLVKNKKMIIVASRGGDYSQEMMAKFDFQESYLRTVFGFVGITDINFVVAQPMDALGPQVKKQKIEEAQAAARKIADSL